MSNACSGCSSASSCDQTSCSTAQEPQLTMAQQLSKVKNIIVVLSGKGGVGKSSFTSLVAVALQKQGHKVGILDGDITGPSIPKIFGVKGAPETCEFGAYPKPSSTGIGIMSINLLLPNEDEPVVWRGPVISGVIKQFWEEVVWGELDYLIVDLPPGTGDAPLTILQTLPVSGVLIVTSPQDLANMVVRKAVKMVNMMNIPIIGIAENMSYLPCPDCDKKIAIFGESNVESTCNDFGIPLIGKFPLDPQIPQLADKGQIEQYDGPVLAQLAESFTKILDK